MEDRYEVSNLGRVRHIKTSHMLKITQPTPGHKNDSKYCRIHRLVAQAFLPHSDDSLQVNHIDGNKFNNCKENLEWCTDRYNIQHSIDSGLRKSPPKGVYRGPVHVKCDQTNQIFKNMKEAAECMNIKYNYLQERIRLHRPCHGYTFTILKDEGVTIQ